MKLEYYCKGDYRFLNLVITRSEMVIKKYGMLWKAFLKAYKSGWYQSMLLILSNSKRKKLSKYAILDSESNKNMLKLGKMSAEEIAGSYLWKGGLDLLNIVLIGISNELPEHDEKYELHRLLSTLLSMELTATEKLEIIKTEYHIPVDDELRKDVREMCNLFKESGKKGAEGE